MHIDSHYSACPSLRSSLSPSVGHTRSRALSGALVLVLAGLFATMGAGSAHAAPARHAAAAPAQGGAQLVASEGAEAEGPADEGGEDEGILAKVNAIYPIYLDSDLEPEVADKVLPLWLTSACFGQLCGSLWIPMLIVGEDPGMEYFAKEAIIAIALEMLTNAVGGVGSAVGGIGTVLITANLLYLTPVSIINTYDRALKRERAQTAEKSAQLRSATDDQQVAMAF